MRNRWLVASALLVTAACATIMHGSSQDVAIASVPTGADITVDGRPVGQTPLTTSLRRKDAHTIHLSMKGFQPFEMNLTRHVSGWVWGNIVFGGLIGLAVDAITGGLYEIKPDQVMGQLQKSYGMISKRGDALYVVLVAAPDPSWVRIGSLVPAAP